MLNDKLRPQTNKFTNLIGEKIEIDPNIVTIIEDITTKAIKTPRQPPLFTLVEFDGAYESLFTISDSLQIELPVAS